MIPKFRAWDKQGKTMNDVESIKFDWNRIFLLDWCVACKFEDIDLMQSTGLKDKNGVEIFEGDIISGWVSAHSHSGRDKVLKVVKYQVDRAGFNFDGVDVIVDDNEYLEVIGNVWEDGDLINDGKRTKEN